MSETEESTSRPKRKRSDKGGRLSAFEKLKQLKGSKHKYEVEEMESVYEEVDEREYTKTVLERQNDDWIVDDGQSGYIEDGREIFDDDLDDESIQQAKKQKLSGPRKKKEDPKKKGSISNMFMNMSAKKKANEAIDDDNILSELMNELKSNETVKKPLSVSPAVRNKFSVAHRKDNTSPSGNKKNLILSTRTTSTNDNTKQKLDCIIEDDVIEQIFDAPSKSNKSESINNQTNAVARIQSVSQEIIDEPCEELEDNTITESQIIEDLTQDFNQPESFSKKLSGEESKVNKNLTNDQAAKDLNDVNSYMEELSEVDFSNFTDEQEIPMPCSNSGRIKDSDEMLNEDVKINIEDLNVFNEVWNSEQTTQTSTKSSEKTEELPIPLVTNEDGDQVFRFYWLDAYEDIIKHPGIVYLFGKTYVQSIKEYRSCCITIKNIPRRIYLLPRKHLKSSSDEEPVLTTIQDVYKEFNEYANKAGIKEFICKTVTKSYAFDQKDVPVLSEYLEVRYSANYPALDSNYSGTAIEKVFGTTISPLELLLIERKIKGPSWLDIKCAVPSGLNINWCSIKVNCLKMENVSVTPLNTPNLSVPPLVMATINVRTCLNKRLQQNEVVMAAILIQHKYHIDKKPPKTPFDEHYCIITKPRDIPWPRQARDVLSKIKYANVIKCENEADLYTELLRIVEEADPDLLIGYDCKFQFDVLLHRMQCLKVPNWSRLGRLKRSVPPLMKGIVHLNRLLAGRPLCDVQTSAQELCLKVRSYDLQSLCMEVLKKKPNECKEIKPGECLAFYNTVEKIENLIQLTLTEALHILNIVIELNVIPLALQITCIAGNILSRTLSAGRAERNEYLLLHAFFAKNYITPDKRITKAKDPNNDNKNETSRRKKPAYTGGLVFEPKKGFYDKLVLLMDFNSLYPSIIQEYNLCFTTVPGAAYAAYVEDLTVPESDQELGVVPTEIRKLVESRVEVKKLIKTPNISPELKMQYHIRQLALKLTANSMYGCLGAVHCRFYAKALAALITEKGREILQSTKSLVEKLNYEVLYGDTDSLMINTNILDYDEVFSIGRKIKQEVNKLYRRVELDIDGVFRYLLLLKKKKYAAVTMSKLPSGQIEMAQEHKGLDIVRRDWCQLACDTGRKILTQLFSEKSVDNRIEQIFNLLEDVANRLRNNQVSLASLVITKQLAKNPNDYPDKRQPHVLVALRLNKEGGRMWKSGDTIPYIICEDGTTNSPAERSYHVDEYKKNESLKIDINYYLLSQIFPIVLRICDPIEGIDDVLLAKTLGISHLYKAKEVTNQDIKQATVSENDRFDRCIPLKFKCRNVKCGAEIILNDVIHKDTSELTLVACTNKECNMAPWKYVNAIQNDIQLAAKAAIKEYYAGWLQCDNPLCEAKVRRVHLSFSRGIHLAKCRKCKDANMHKIYSEEQLYNQIRFYLHVFDVHESKHKQLLSKCSQNVISAYDTLKEFVEKLLRRSGYSVINLSELFAPFAGNRIQTEEYTNEEELNLSNDELASLEFQSLDE